MFDPLAVREAVLQRLPEARVDQLPLHRDAGNALHLWIELPDASNGGALVTTALVLDPTPAPSCRAARPSSGRSAGTT